jgi:hypothetical protein
LRKRIQDFFNERIRAAASRCCRIVTRGRTAATYTSIVAVTGT